MNLVQKLDWAGLIHSRINQPILRTGSTVNQKEQIFCEADIINSKSLIRFKDYFNAALFVIFGA